LLDFKWFDITFKLLLKKIFKNIENLLEAGDPPINEQ